MWLLLSTALAADPPALAVEAAVLPWAEVGFAPGASGGPAFGPDRLTGGPDGLAAVYDTVGQRVIVLSDLAVSAAVALPKVVDLAFTADGDLLVLQDRTLSLVDVRGATFDQLALGDVAGAHSALRVDGDTVWITDHFGRWHRIARINIRDLAASEAAILPKATVEVSVDAPRATVIVDGSPYKVPRVRAAEARVVEGAGRRWLVLDAVVAEGAPPKRTAWLDGRSAPVPTEGQPYVPADALALDADGRLLVIVPSADGLRVLRLSPG